MANSKMTERIPIFLLKTRSTPSDAYEDLFQSAPDGFDFEPYFVPVLEHRFQDEGMARVKSVLLSKGISGEEGSPYGGLVFTSQRAVEGFSHLVRGGPAREDDEETWPHLQEIPVYSVGPATTRALQAVPQEPPLQIFGSHTGNGEDLSKFILEHYGAWYKDRTSKPPLLFLVGEQRRDIIPKTLMDATLPAEKQIKVDEVVVYGTGVMESFRDDFEVLLQETEGRKVRWAVVFSPSGCDNMLRALGMLDEATGRVKETKGPVNTYVATIGPTTRNHLLENFGFEPHASADYPSPEGIWKAISSFHGK
ncbi:Tetrapyrrole biosynthesis, uroporphyrinogen III synthase [Rhypophila decipiens]